MGAQDLVHEDLKKLYDRVSDMMQAPASLQTFATQKLEAGLDYEKDFHEARLTLNAKSAANRADGPSGRGNITFVEGMRFATTLVDAWAMHNAKCDELDGLLRDWERDGTTAREKVLATFDEMINVDDVKRRHSLGIKDVIKALWAQEASVTPQELADLALSPREPAFWIAYLNDHASAPITDVVIDRYHRGSEAIAARRRIEDELLRASTGVKLPWFAAEKWDVLSMTPALHVIDFLLFIDNLAEPLWMKSAVGLPDWLFRCAMAEVVYQHTARRINPLDDQALRANFKEAVK